MCLPSGPGLSLRRLRCSQNTRASRGCRKRSLRVECASQHLVNYLVRRSVLLHEHDAPKTHRGDEPIRGTACGARVAGLARGTTAAAAAAATAAAFFSHGGRTCAAASSRAAIF